MELKTLASLFFLLSFAVYLLDTALLTFLNSRLAKEEKNHFRNSFPFEFYRQRNPRLRFVLYALVFLSLFFLLLGTSLYFVTFESIFAYAELVIFGLVAVLMAAGNILPLSSYRSHLLTNLSSFLLLSLGMILFAFQRIVPGAMIFPSEILVPIAVLSGILGFVSFFALFQKKLLNWAKLDKAEENGATYYVKPKVNLLALYEWIYFLLFEIQGLLFFFNIVFQ